MKTNSRGIAVQSKLNGTGIGNVRFNVELGDGACRNFVPILEGDEASVGFRVDQPQVLHGKFSSRWVLRRFPAKTSSLRGKGPRRNQKNE